MPPPEKAPLVSRRPGHDHAHGHDHDHTPGGGGGAGGRRKGSDRAAAMYALLSRLASADPTQLKYALLNLTEGWSPSEWTELSDSEDVRWSRPSADHSGGMAVEWLGACGEPV
eukprot:SAG22_NODE_12162_length_454_cov_0.726761_1_plen_112_part_10